MATEAQKRAIAKYDASHTVQIKLKLNLETDKDVIEKLNEVDNKQGYIKRLIREDIGAGKVKYVYKELGRSAVVIDAETDEEAIDKARQLTYKGTLLKNGVKEYIEEEKDFAEHSFAKHGDHGIDIYHRW